MAFSQSWTYGLCVRQQRFMSRITVTPPSMRLHCFPSATALADRLHSSASALHSMSVNFVSAHFRMSDHVRKRTLALAIRRAAQTRVDLTQIELGIIGALRKKPRLSASEAVNPSGMEAPSTSLLPNLNVPTSTVDPEQVLPESDIEPPAPEDPPLAAPEIRTRRGRLAELEVEGHSRSVVQPQTSSATITPLRRVRLLLTEVSTTVANMFGLSRRGCTNGVHHLSLPTMAKLISSNDTYQRRARFHQDLCYLLWPDNEYDAQEPARGFLEHQLIVKTMIYILTAPSAAPGGSRRRSRGLSKAYAVSYNINVVNGNFVAFAAIAVHFALSSQNEMDGAACCGIWPYGKLHITVIDFIDDHLSANEQNELILWYPQIVSAP
ncbi:hypothetical protein BXZ70DRAFT_57017 [Cristinia sonorae]|uniref:Uncharacterized protein n=1 Tax=Cristinia sonorae TaxID=1940300 RepID=A0A8K0XRS1_9AGAR|nr:hypothetical protein BXZ70DRAFT_57017 [Cristinia sonorae]